MHPHAPAASVAKSIACCVRSFSLGFTLSIALLVGLLACSGKPREESPASEQDVETVLIPECQQYAGALRACVEKTGMPGANALVVADANARVPTTLSVEARRDRATGCAAALRVLESTCR